MNDPYWKPCLETQIIQVSEDDFAKMMHFVEGETQVAQLPKYEQLNQLYRGFEWVQKMFKESSDRCLEFLAQYMNTPLEGRSLKDNKNDMLAFFADELNKDNEIDDRKREENKIKLENLLENNGIVEMAHDDKRIKDSLPIQAVKNETPLFMQKFMGGSNKFTDDNGKDYFNGNQDNVGTEAWKENFK